MMSTAIREAAPAIDDSCDKTDLDSDLPTGGTASPGSERETVPPATRRDTTTIGAAHDASSQDIHAEYLTMLERSLGMLPSDLLEPLIASSCPWYGDLPPAAARQCLSELREARVAGHVSAVLLRWRGRALPFAS